MAKGDWWFKFEFLLWLTDEQLNRCSLETQGFWLRVISIMRKSGSAKLSGSVSDLSRLLSATPEEFQRCFADLNRTKTADVTQKSEIFTLVSRKYAKELKVKEQNRLRKRRERRHADVSGESHDRVKSNKKEVINKEEEKREREPARAPSKATRLPDLWNPGPHLLAWAISDYPKANALNETLLFKNYYAAAPGDKGLKTNWDKTWQNWIIKAGTIYAKEENQNGANQRNGGNGNKQTTAEFIDATTEFYANYPGGAACSDIPVDQQIPDA